MNLIMFHAGRYFLFHGGNAIATNIINLSNLDGSNRFLDGVAAEDYLGRLVSNAEDINSNVSIVRNRVEINALATAKTVCCSCKTP